MISFIGFIVLWPALAADSHDGRDDEDPRSPDETDGEHGEADILGLIEVTS